MKKYKLYKNKFDIKKFVKISNKENNLLKCLSFSYGIKGNLDIFNSISSMGLERFFLLISDFGKYKISYSRIIIIEDYPADGSFQYHNESGILTCRVNNSIYSYFIRLDQYNLDEEIFIIKKNKKNEKFSNKMRIKLMIDDLKLKNPGKKMPCQKVFINNEIKWNKSDITNLKNVISSISFRKKIKFTNW